MEIRAKQFFDRGIESSCYEEKVLCFYNAFFVLYGKGCSAKIAEICNTTEDRILKAVDSCREEHEGERTVLSEYEISLLYDFLGKF